MQQSYVLFLHFQMFFFSLQNLRKHCDVNLVAEAHLLMKNVAKNIDQVKKNLEQERRVKELSGILDGWLGPGMDNRMIFRSQN